MSSYIFLWLDNRQIPFYNRTNFPLSSLFPYNRRVNEYNLTIKSTATDGS
jgi:hypothetical protein